MDRSYIVGRYQIKERQVCKKGKKPQSAKRKQTGCSDLRARRPTTFGLPEEKKRAERKGQPLNSANQCGGQGYTKNKKKPKRGKNK